MAGGKETPRQKMIGMMYLVLTALLALQVSSAVLEKFAIINETMLTFKEETNKKNAATLNEIVKEAGKSPNAKVVKARIDSYDTCWYREGETGDDEVVEHRPRERGIHQRPQF
jgi:hypothetical protein